MSYTKVFDVCEDDERVYFSFYTNHANKKIIGLPKQHSNNQNIYAGFTFQKLDAVSKKEARIMLSSLMREKLKRHPMLSLCNEEAIQIIGM